MTSSDEAPDKDLEQRKLEEDVRLRTRELDIKQMEAEAALKAQEKTRWTNPLVLAVLAAALAGLANFAVAWRTGADQLALTKDKNDEERQIEETKAESARILEVVKSSDPDRAAQNLKFLLDSYLITTPARREKLTAYLAERKGGQGISIQEASTSTPSDPSKTPKISTADPDTPLPPPQVSKPPTGPGPIIATFKSGWVSGGHSQDETCSQGIAQLKSQNPGKDFKVISSSEDSNKDIFGHVTYNYTCVVGQK